METRFPHIVEAGRMVQPAARDGSPGSSRAPIPDSPLALRKRRETRRRLLNEAWEAFSAAIVVCCAAVLLGMALAQVF